MDTVKQANRDINSLQPLAKQACTMFLEECKKQGVNIFVTEYHRSQARQNWLYEQGRTRPGNIVTWTRNSNHTSGYAFDIAVSPPHNLYDINIISKAGAIAESLGIEWGGNWKTPDNPHFQIGKGWKPKVIIKEDIQLAEACSKIIKSGINLNFNSWKRVDLIKLNNVDALLSKFGGIDKLIKDGAISSKDIWIGKKYNVNHVRSLIIKYADKL